MVYLPLNTNTPERVKIFDHATGALHPKPAHRPIILYGHLDGPVLVSPGQRGHDRPPFIAQKKKTADETSTASVAASSHKKVAGLSSNHRRSGREANKVQGAINFVRSGNPSCFNHSEN